MVDKTETNRSCALCGTLIDQDRHFQGVDKSDIVVAVDAQISLPMPPLYNKLCCLRQQPFFIPPARDGAFKCYLS
jgi:hypothetical protein